MTCQHLQEVTEQQSTRKQGTLPDAAIDDMPSFSQHAWLLGPCAQEFPEDLLDSSSPIPAHIYTHTKLLHYGPNEPSLACKHSLS